jgi:hypothetical protein
MLFFTSYFVRLVICTAESESGLGPWYVSNVGAETLESYIANKFGIWKSHMMNAFGGCAAAFLPELRRGYALSNLYDHMIFSSSDAEKSQWETEHNGRMVPIPRPVAALRVWDSVVHEYKSVSPQMPGAPDNSNPVEREQYWIALLEELKSHLNPKYGPDFIQDCLSMNVPDVKAKYGF